MIESLNSSPATRTDSLITVPCKLSTATSVVPPPMSIIILPVGSATGKPAPMAAATGSSIRYTSLAPAWDAASITARRSTPVTPLGMPMTMRGETRALPSLTRWIKCLSINSAESKSAITPSRKGRKATTLPGVLPNIFFASSPTARGIFLSWSIATTDGSWSTIPLPDT